MKVTVKRRLLALVLLFTPIGHAQSNVAGLLYASNFATWTVPQGNQGLTSWSSPSQCTVTSGGTTFRAFAVDVPVTLNDAEVPANSEVVTPTAVGYNGFGCSISAPMAHPHKSFYFTTATAGLGEALTFAGTQPYQIVLTPDWQRLGGTTGTITAAKGNSAVTISDQRTASIEPYIWNGSVYVQTPFSNGNLPSAPAAGYTPVSSSAGTTSYAAQMVAAPVLNASNLGVSGADIGARANTLFTQLSSASQLGTVTMDPTAAENSNYALSTGIEIPEGDILDCQGANLVWSGTTLAAAVTYTGASQATAPGGMRNCHLVGAGGTSGNSSIGFYAGGDPNSVLSPSSNYGNFFSIQGSSIFGFGKGYSHGNNTWANVIDGSYFDSNYDQVYSSASSSTNNGEATKITNSNFYNAGHCGFNLNWAGDAYYMIGGHLDFNTAGAVCGTWADLQLQNVWMESFFGPGINIIGGSAQDYISVTGGHYVLDASPLTITNVAVTSNVLTITATGGTPNGYWVGHPLTFLGVGTATFLNGTQGTIQTVTTGGGTTTVTLAYTHANYASAADTGTVQQYSPDIYHMEGGPGSYFLATGVHEIVNSQILTQGFIPAVLGLGSTTQSAACVKDLIGPQYAIVGTYANGCLYDSRVQLRGGTGATLATFSAGGDTPQVGTQGWTLDWSYFSTGETELINIHGLGVGGFYLCDVADSVLPTPSTCQLHLDASGNLTTLGAINSSSGTAPSLSAANTFTQSQTAASFIPQSKAAGPNVAFFDDFFSTGNLVLAAIGSATGDACSTVNALDTNHPGIFQAVSGTGASGTGAACIIGSSRVLVTPYNTAWTYETDVQPSVLPGTTASSFQAGLTGTLTGNAWTSAVGFNLSSANANANHWYCQDGGTYVDTGVTATLAWSRMTIVNNGTNTLWYINGTQVCSETSSGLPTSNMFLEWTSTTLTASTSATLYTDYVNFNQSVTR